MAMEPSILSVRAGGFSIILVYHLWLYLTNDTTDIIYIHYYYMFQSTSDFYRRWKNAHVQSVYSA